MFRTAPTLQKARAIFHIQEEYFSVAGESARMAAFQCTREALQWSLWLLHSILCTCLFSRHIVTVDFVRGLHQSVSDWLLTLPLVFVS